MTDFPRLIEYAFPLKQTSLDSVHEKNVRHGHISTLHIWPARRPLAACRAALIATLLPDPGDAGEAAGAVREDRRQGREEDRTQEDAERPDRRAGQGGDRGRHPALGPGDGERRDAGVVPAGNPQGLRRARAEGARPVRRRRRDPAGSHAAGLRSHGRGHQPGRLVHPEMHARIPAEAGRADAATAGLRPG